MYLHLGQDYIVPLQSVVAVFDMDTATVSKRTRRLLERLQEAGDRCFSPAGKPILAEITLDELRAKLR